MAELGLTGIDWIIIGVLAISTVISAFRGFVKEALSLATWIAAMIVARLFAADVSTLLVETIEVPSIRLGVAYAILVFGTLIVGGLLNHLISELVKISGLGGTDRFLGMFFGLARGGLVVLLIVAGLHYLAPVENDTWWQQSVLIPHFIEAVEYLGPILWEQGEQLFNMKESIKGT